MGKPPKKKKSKRLFLRLFIFLIIIIILFLGLMFFLSSRANVDDLQSIEKKSNFVSAQHMPEYVRGAF
ncbi:glycosyltransferase, partial [Corynebacterium amycolatum]|nr:glycosyltransferase [Corynebacterium amycolatum]